MFRFFVRLDNYVGLSLYRDWRVRSNTIQVHVSNEVLTKCDFSSIQWTKAHPISNIKVYFWFILLVGTKWIFSSYAICTYFYLREWGIVRIIDIDGLRKILHNLILMDWVERRTMQSYIHNSNFLNIFQNYQLSYQFIKFRQVNEKREERPERQRQMIHSLRHHRDRVVTRERDSWVVTLTVAIVIFSAPSVDCRVSLTSRNW